MNYDKQLQRARARTVALGYCAAPACAAEPVAVKPLFEAIDSFAVARQALARRIARPAGCDVAAECARLVLACTAPFNDAIGRRATLTLGSVDYHGTQILRADLDDVAELRRRACYHVWWSLGAEQIVDLTLMAHLALLKGGQPRTIVPLVGAPAAFAAIRWHPHLTGEAVITALTGAVTCAASGPFSPGR